MNQTKYIGMDVHQATISVAVLDAAGKLILESVLETKASTILQFLAGLRGSLYVTLEEGTSAAWLHDLLRPHVTKVLVCDPRRNALLKDGNKSDRIDAQKLAELLYLNKLSPVYHGENGVRTLKELARSYLTITKDLTRVMNRIKALYRSWAIPCQPNANASPLPPTLQIGFVGYPGGEFHSVTKDTNSYQTLTLSADGRTLAAVQQKHTQTLYVLPAGGFTGTPPAPAAAQSRNSHYFDWANNGEVYFDGNLVRVSLDGSNRTTLLSDPTGGIFRPRTCPLGGYVLFVGHGHPDSNDADIFRIDADGTNLKQLSHGVADVGAACSRDGRWVYYTDLANLQMMRVPFEGGNSEVVPGSATPGMSLAVPGIGLSHDGKHLAFVV